MEEKAFQPTKKRLDEARKQGRVLKSPLLTQSLVLFAIITLGYPLVGIVWLKLKFLLEYSWNYTTLDLQTVLWRWYKLFCVVVGVTLSISCAVGLFSESMQVGLKFGSLKFDFAKLEPSAGLKRIISGIKDSTWLVLRGITLAAVLYYLLAQIQLAALGLGLLSLPLMLAKLQTLLWKPVRVLAAIVLVFGILDYGFKRRKFFKELSMSRDELLREMKDDEGDPLIRANRKALHEALLMKDIVARVRKAKVVIVERS